MPDLTPEQHALASLAEAALMGSGAARVRSDPYLCDLVKQLREQEAVEYQALVEESRRQRAERFAASEARSRV